LPRRKFTLHDGAAQLPVSQFGEREIGFCGSVHEFGG
jgi:hypothetical protein